MAGVVTSCTVCSGGNHITAGTVVIDGVSIDISGQHIEAGALTTEETAQFVRLGLRRLRAAGIEPSAFLNRITNGDEATNVKIYNFLGPGAAVAKTNIGTSYVNINPGLNGERILINFTGCTQYRLIATANLVGTGPFGLRAVRDSDDAVLYENASISQTGERELDTGWQTLPAAASGEMLCRVQAKSTVAADDPVFRRVAMAVR